MKNIYSQKETDILNYAEMNKNKWKNMGIEYCTGTVIPYFCFQKIAREIETE